MQLFLVFIGNGSAVLVVFFFLLIFVINARSSGLIPMGINLRWCWGFLLGK